MSDTFTSILQIPLLNGPQSFFVSLDGIEYNLVLTYHDAIGGGWTIDILASDSSPILCGVPLVVGLDMLEPYSDLALPPGALCAMSQPQPDLDATFDGLGISTLLYYVTP